jgi:23S rRNA (guanine2445-N2)-methyltransferase / 23S rRNA (guanine2069-N7)-methyltransferase
LENLLAEEITKLGLQVVRTNPRGVFVAADKVEIHRLRLWSRLANRIFVILATARQSSREHLLAAAESVQWQHYLTDGAPIWIHAHGTYGDLKHSGFAAQVLKDGIYDSLRRQMKALPPIDQHAAAHRLQVSVGKETYILLDLLGQSLHQRGYRTEGGVAPLKENLAAAILLRAGWPGNFDALTDPMCGSGTLLIEGAMMALDIAPGLLKSFAHPVDPLVADSELCASMVAEAMKRRDSASSDFHMRFRGYDQSADAIAIARRNISRAGLAAYIGLEVMDARKVTPADDGKQGLMVTNPPYGERLGEKTELMHLYRELGTHWKAKLGGWRIGVFTSQEDLARSLGLTPDKIYQLFNGPIAAQLAIYTIHPSQAKAAHQQRVAEHLHQDGLDEGARNKPIWSDQTQMLVNRLQKNLKKRQVWVKKEGLEAWRLYDADMPEYAVAIDIYRNAALVQEYAPPKTIDPEKAESRLNDVMKVVPAVLGIPKSMVTLKQRKRQKGTAQYEKLNDNRHEFAVNEYGASLLVNLEDYLDTGLFLDHRPTRRFIQQNASGCRFLNLFSYTGAATVHACLGGARETCSVDLSQTYLDWTLRNLRLNGFDSAGHRLVRANVMEWLATEKSQFDLIFVDPPTFSNSKRMEGVFDVQRDHVQLLELALARLGVKGLLIFSTNFRKFQLDASLSERFLVEDVTAKSIPEDYGRDSKIHQCWQFRRKTQSPWG